MIAIYREEPMASTGPTTDNGRTIAGMYEAFGRGNVPHVLAQMALDVEWIETEAENIPTHGHSPVPRRCSRVSSLRFLSTSSSSNSTRNCGSKRATMWS
jgi:hypothetical protein